MSLQLRCSWRSPVRHAGGPARRDTMWTWSAQQAWTLPTQNTHFTPSTNVFFDQYFRALK